MSEEEKSKSVRLEELLEKMSIEIKGKDLHSFVVERVVTIIIAALGLIAALSWDDALKHFFRNMVGGATVGQEFLYALSVTIFAAVISYFLGRSFIKNKKREMDKNILK